MCGVNGTPRNVLRGKRPKVRYTPHADATYNAKNAQKCVTGCRPEQRVTRKTPKSALQGTGRCNMQREKRPKVRYRVPADATYYAKNARKCVIGCLPMQRITRKTPKSALQGACRCNVLRGKRPKVRYRVPADATYYAENAQKCVIGCTPMQHATRKTPIVPMNNSFWKCCPENKRDARAI